MTEFVGGVENGERVQVGAWVHRQGEILKEWILKNLSVD